MNRDPANTLHVNHVNAERQRFGRHNGEPREIKQRVDELCVRRGLEMQARAFDGRILPHSRYQDE